MLFMTLANKVTSARFLLCILYYVLLTMAAGKPSANRDVQLLTVIFILNQVIAWSDILDGYLARKYKEVTHFGRIADPLVDKILVVGSFIFFLVIDPLPKIFTAWFAVVVLGREFLVSGIRGAMEAAGIPFPASVWGKIKTAIQNVTVGTGLGYATWLPTTRWAELLTITLMWATLVATVMSGVTYVLSARKFLGSERI
ncbi:MAG: CDP-diacylglycerol--glycerol-3-phosphate 3-phosphatidyltransferase [Planctomycetota bacterium]|nr:MAG: CDP-diacylglycerol--glycerol-3-phosphate 3-phosphatidyltransferase [Planctomycetota bacterium]